MNGRSKRGGRKLRGGKALNEDCTLVFLRGLRVSISGEKPAAGFALVITVVLLALLVLVVFALSTLSRVGAAVAATGNQQVQARQHALLGLSQAVGVLQRYAAEDDVLTGIAGLTGIPSGPNQPARHWCGVWDRDGDFLHWLASGADNAPIPVLDTGDTFALVANGSLGADGSEKEHVRAPLQPVEINTRDRASVRLGAYAWWVGDEGVKLSAVLPEERHAIDTLITLAPDAPPLTSALSYEQIALVPTTITPTALAGQLRANFHALGRAHLGVTGPVPVAGLLNINTTSHPFWRGLASTYNRLKPSSAATLSPVAFADWMRDHFSAADPGAGKAANGPYPSVDLFLNSAALTGALTAGGGSLLDFGDVMRPWLAVRSDTFRVRACGDAVNPADPTRTVATAWCEAIVQRVKDDPAATSGRFVITYFRWLGADDI
ncbi:MAG: hypothetical protein ACOZE5_02290 [Verrucomicrobiota bacterium]